MDKFSGVPLYHLFYAVSPYALTITRGEREVIRMLIDHYVPDVVDVFGVLEYVGKNMEYVLKAYSIGYGEIDAELMSLNEQYLGLKLVWKYDVEKGYVDIVVRSGAEHIGKIYDDYVEKKKPPKKQLFRVYQVLVLGGVSKEFLEKLSENKRCDIRGYVFSSVFGEYPVYTLIVPDKALPKHIYDYGIVMETCKPVVYKTVFSHEKILGYVYVVEEAKKYLEQAGVWR